MEGLADHEHALLMYMKTVADSQSQTHGLRLSVRPDATLLLV